MHGDHVLREAAHVGGAQPFIALEQQPGANEQDHSQSDFERQQHLAQRGPRTAPAHRARCLMQRAENALVAAAERSDESGKQRAQHDNADRKRRHHAIDVDGFDAAHVVASSRQPMKRGEGEQKSQRAAGGRKQQALHQPLADQTQPAPAQCGADSQLFAPCRRARHQQIGHIEAGDQQQAAGRLQQHIERLLDFAYHVLQQRTALGALKYEWVVEVRIVDALGDDAQIGHALRRADFRLQPPHNAKHVLAERGHLFFGLVVVNRCP